MKRKLFAILMMLTLMLTYMPAIAFADDGDEPEDRGNPVSLEFIHDGDYEVEGSYTQDGDVDEETGEWEATSDPYIHYYVPGFVEGDIVNVTYENGQTVSYVNTTVHVEEMDYDDTNFRSTEDSMKDRRIQMDQMKRKAGGWIMIVKLSFLKTERLILQLK